jgi:hypothetical protein
VIGVLVGDDEQVDPAHPSRHQGPAEHTRLGTTVDEDDTAVGAAQQYGVSLAHIEHHHLRTGRRQTG